MYTGVEGSPLEKGELFGLKNIFRYRPEGFVVQNVGDSLICKADACSLSVCASPKNRCAPIFLLQSMRKSPTMTKRYAASVV